MGAALLLQRATEDPKAMKAAREETTRKGCVFGQSDRDQEVQAETSTI